MTQYLLIESRDPYESGAVAHDYALARSLAEEGDEVTLFLVQNGVLPARRGARAPHAPHVPHLIGLAEVAASGATVVADEFSLRERGIPMDGLADGVAPAPLELVLDQLADGAKTLWL